MTAVRQRRREAGPPPVALGASRAWRCGCGSALVMAVRPAMLPRESDGPSETRDPTESGGPDSFWCLGCWTTAFVGK
jgi:hypothetical protein